MNRTKETTSSKRILVSFSGGLDSTYLVYDNLRKGYKVTGVYTTIENNSNKAEVEKYQVRKLEELFNKEFNDNFNLNMGMSVYASFHNTLSFKQTAIWLFSLLYEGDGYDEMHIGAVMNDDMVSFMNDIKKMWQSLAFLQEERHPPLKFPLAKVAKWQIAKELPKQYKDLVVFCENPIILKPITKKNKTLEFERCGQCHSCKRYEYDSEMFNMEYGQVKKMALPELRKKINNHNLSPQEINELLALADEIKGRMVDVDEPLMNDEPCEIEPADVKDVERQIGYLK